MPDAADGVSRVKNRRVPVKSGKTDAVDSLRASLRPLRQDTLGTQVLRELRGYIRSRGLGAGDRLPTERDLAEVLGVSRNTVREAMNSLESVGIIERKPRRGTTLKEVDLSLIGEILRFSLIRTRADLEEMLTVRRMLEVNMLPMVVANATEEDWARMEEANRRMEADKEVWSHAVEADLAFHRALLAATGNTMLYQFHGMIREFFDEVSFYYARDRQGLVEKTLKEHRLLIERLRAGNVAGAQRVMEMHLISPTLREEQNREKWETGSACADLHASERQEGTE